MSEALSPFTETRQTETIEREILVGGWEEGVHSSGGNSMLLQQVYTGSRIKLPKQRRRKICAGYIPWAALVLLLIGGSSSCCSALMSTRLFRAATRGLGRSASNRHPWQTFATGTTGSRHVTITKPLSTDETNPNNGDVSMHEIELSLPDGMVLRGERWCTHPQQLVDDDNDASTKILALHGWLDNCRSFYYLAPKLLEEFAKHDQTAEFVAIDLPGHGRSSHRPIDGPSAVLSEGLYYVAEAIDALGWNSHMDTDTNETQTPPPQEEQGVALVGHSMGGSLASLYAGVFPEQVSKLVNLDIYGPEPRDPQQTHLNLRSHILQRKLAPKPKKAIYPSLERAIERRQKAATLSRGGQQYISKQAATELVTRAMEPLYEASSDGTESAQQQQPILKGYQFLHDARLMWPSLQYMTQEQIQSILEAVECPVCILAAEDGYPFEKDRIERMVTALNPEIHKILPGSHHLHADPDTADAVVEAIYEFFCKDENGNSGIAKR